MQIQINNTFLDKNKTKNGGWTKRQFQIIGIEWPPKKNWKKQVIGQKISTIDAIEFENISKKSTCSL